MFRLQQSRNLRSRPLRGNQMTANNLPKGTILLVGLLCLTALMISDKIDMASGVPMLTLIIGYAIRVNLNERGEVVVAS